MYPCDTLKNECELCFLVVRDISQILSVGSTEQLLNCCFGMFRKTVLKMYKFSILFLKS